MDFVLLFQLLCLLGLFLGFLLLAIAFTVNE
jgi:hypothetical protein